MHKDILIVGGSSGIGLALAKRYLSLGHRVTITGRKDPGLAGAKFLVFNISSDSQATVRDVDQLLMQCPSVNTLIYAAGFEQTGTIDQLGESEIAQAIHVGLFAPALLVRRLKGHPEKPLKVMLVTSSAQYTPRAVEPIYTAVKAGLGMLGASLGWDSDLGKVLVIAPSGTQTPFWRNQPHKNISDYLAPDWVADQIVLLSSGPFKYRYAKLLRNPARVEIVETRT